MYGQIGKRRALLIFLIQTYLVHAGVQLQVTTPGGAPCSRVGAGSFCVVKVTCQGQGPQSFPTVTGLQAFRLEGRSKSMSSINGVTSTTYMYQMRALQPGKYSIGPAYVTINGATESSNTVSVHVLDAHEAQREREATEKAPILMLRLEVDTPEVVVGQTVHGTLSLHCRADHRMDSLIVDHIDTPQWQELGITIEREPELGKTSVDGVEYTVYEWHWSLVPTKAGALVIPACGASCRLPTAMHDDDLFAGLSAFLGGFKQQRVYSKIARIMVNDLPPGNPVHAIGSFTAMKAWLDNARIQQPNAVTLSIAITGDEAVREFSLSDVPKALRCYDAKRTVSHHEDTDETTTLFEFVVQGVDPGTWQIPQQLFRFFDPQSYRYQELSTQRLSLAVEPAAKSTRQPQEDAISPDSITPSESVLYDTQWQSAPERGALPFSLFIVLMLAPLITSALWYAYSRYRVKRTHDVSKRGAFAGARKAIANARRAGNACQVYTIFLNLWAMRLKTTSAHIDQDQLLATMRAAGMPEEEYAAWNMFVVRMMSMAYAAYTVHDEHFFREAEQWLDRMALYL